MLFSLGSMAMEEGEKQQKRVRNLSLQDGLALGWEKDDEDWSCCWCDSEDGESMG